MKHTICFGILFSICLQVANAQDTTKTVPTTTLPSLYSDSLRLLISSKQYEPAAKLAHRLQFYYGRDRNDTLALQAKQWQQVATELSGRHREAASLAGDIAKRSTSSYQKTLWQIAEARCLLLDKNYKSAQHYIDQVKLEDSSLSISYYTTKGLIHFYFQDQYKEAGRSFQMALGTSATLEDSLIIDSLICRADKIDSRWNAYRVGLSSLVVPGIGHTFYGNWRDAVNSFLLNGTLIAGTVYIGYVYSPTTALFAGVPHAARYYFLGAVDASQKANKKLEREKQAIAELILQRLLNK